MGRIAQGVLAPMRWSLMMGVAVAGQVWAQTPPETTPIQDTVSRAGEPSYFPKPAE